MGEVGSLAFFTHVVAVVSARQVRWRPRPATVAPWPLWLAVTVLAVTGILAALVSDWFVAALTPAMEALHISQAFAGLLISALLAVFITLDGESTWYEGVILVALYALLAASFWRG